MDKTLCVNVLYVINAKSEPTARCYRLLPVGKEGEADALFELFTKTFAENRIEWKYVLNSLKNVVFLIDKTHFT